jgi:hypothetical protein
VVFASAQTATSSDLLPSWNNGPKSEHFGKAEDLCSVRARSIELGFDKSGEGKNLRSHPLHSDLFQNRFELLTKLVKGRSRLPDIDHATAARHRPGNVRE